MKFKKNRQTQDTPQADSNEAAVAGTGKGNETEVSPVDGTDTAATDGTEIGRQSAKVADQSAEVGKSSQAGEPGKSRGYGIPTSTLEEEEAGFRGGSDAGALRSGTGGNAAGSTAVPQATDEVDYGDYQPRQVRLVVSRIEPWTVMKVTFLLAVCFGVAIILASILVWLLLNSMHVFSSVESFINDIDPSGAVAALIDYVRLPRVIAMSTILAVANVILLTAFMTVGALLYNLAASLVGGVKLALTDD